MDHSKSAISVMFCASAAGQLLPPYIIYKGANTYPAWGRNGPPGATYTATTSGWLDTWTYTDWFDHMLPYFNRLPGRKILIGDNLSTHLSMSVIKLCADNNIDFICLPANSTDKMQPLDVGFFGLMKGAWREMLQHYRRRDPEAKCLMKSEFPSMLKELLSKLDPSACLPAVSTRTFLKKITVQYRYRYVFEFFRLNFSSVNLKNFIKKITGMGIDTGTGTRFLVMNF